MENMKIYYFHKVVVIIGCPKNYKGFRKEVSSLWMALQHSKICYVLITTQLWPLPFFKAYKWYQWPCHHHPPPPKMTINIMSTAFPHYEYLRKVLIGSEKENQVMYSSWCLTEGEGFQFSPVCLCVSHQRLKWAKTFKTSVWSSCWKMRE